MKVWFTHTLDYVYWTKRYDSDVRAAILGNDTQDDVRDMGHVGVGAREVREGTPRTHIVNFR
jgi:hypothetical protein